jgi:hypothetical protein
MGFLPKDHSMRLRELILSGREWRVEMERNGIIVLICKLVRSRACKHRQKAGFAMGSDWSLAIELN